MAREFHLIQSIFNWFQKARPMPTPKDQHVQLGVHMEEVVEMLAELSGMNPTARELISSAMAANHELAEYLKANQVVVYVNDVNRKDFLDSLCDQIVTAVGVAHHYGFDLLGALNEVDRSNWSKFVDGSPVFLTNGKIAKGPDYFKPDLSFFADPV